MLILHHDIPYAMTPTSHDCIEPYEWWVTPDGKPLVEGKWYQVTLTRHHLSPDRKREGTRWTFEGPYDAPPKGLEVIT